MAGLLPASYGAKNPFSHKPSLTRPRSCVPWGVFIFMLLAMFLNGTGYNPALKDLNCDFKYSFYGNWYLTDIFKNAFMPLFQCFDFKSLPLLPLVVDFDRKMVRSGALKIRAGTAIQDLNTPIPT